MFQWREFPLTEFKKVKQCGLDNTLNIFPRHTEHNTNLGHASITIQIITRMYFR